MFEIVFYDCDCELVVVVVEYGFDFVVLLQIGGCYMFFVCDGCIFYLSGQVLCIGDYVVVIGVVGVEVSLDCVKCGVVICVLCVLVLLCQEFGSFVWLQGVLCLIVFVYCDVGFIQQSEVVDGVLDLLWCVFGVVGVYICILVGVLQLFKNVVVEVDFIVCVVEF